ncbi:uncharacterized [Tachysurus ichikawai]
MGLHQSSGCALCACDIPVTPGLCHLKRVLEINESACVKRGGKKGEIPQVLCRERGRGRKERVPQVLGENGREREPESPSGVGKVEGAQRCNSTPVNADNEGLARAVGSCSVMDGRDGDALSEAWSSRHFASQWKVKRYGSSDHNYIPVKKAELRVEVREDEAEERADVFAVTEVPAVYKVKERARRRVAEPRKRGKALG